MDNKFYTPIDRILQFIDYKGISIREFSKKVGISHSLLGNSRSIGSDKLSKILYTYPELDITWVILGKGQMLIDKKIEINDFSKENKKNISIENVRPSDTSEMYAQGSEMYAQGVRPTEKDESIYFNNSIQLVPPTLKPFSTISEKRLERQQVPLYDIDASAGIVPILEGCSTPIDYISIPNLPKCDGAVNVRGDSMYPLLKSGDIVLFRNINNFDYIIWGEMYLVSFSHDEEEFCVIKYVKKSEKPDKIMLVSYNENYNSLEIYRDEIRVLAIIQATIRYNTMI